MKIAILATGDEVVSGDILNTNTRFIAQSLQIEGFGPALHMACCDNEKQMLECLDFLIPSHDMIIIIGGLGPTTDDKTRFVLSAFTQEPLVEQAEAMEHIAARLKALNLKMNAGNRQQALFPENTQLFPNPHGSAFGGCYTWKNKQFILLPGPPRECIPMFNTYVLPLLRSLRPTDEVLLKWRLFGIAESVLDEMMEKALADVECETGYRWDPPYVEFKVRCQPSLVETIKKRIDPLAKPHIISSLEENASESLRKFLEALQESVMIRDTATGGVLQTLIQSPANHAFIHFDESNHSPDWEILIQGLDAYWAGKHAAKCMLSLSIKHQNRIMEDAIELPWFNTRVLHYAAEWLSFRMKEKMSSSRPENIDEF